MPLQASVLSTTWNRLPALLSQLRQSRLLRGSLIVGAGILAGNITGFFRVMVTAWFLGTHARADALAVASGPIDTITNAIINSILLSFVPMLTVHKDSARAAIFHRARRVFVPLLLAVSGFIMLFAPALITFLGPGLAREQHDEAVVLLRLIAPSIFFGGTSSLCAALLYSERRFLAPALYQACINGSMVLCALTLWPVFGVKGFAFGYTAGSALQWTLTWLASRDLRRIDPSANSAPVALREILRTPGICLVYASLISCNVLATRAFATHGGPGMAAALDYCLRCLSVVIAYLVYPMSNSLMPEIARLRGAGDTAQAYRLMDRSIKLMATASVLGCLIGIALRTPVIAILFQRGSFTPESTRLVSTVFLGLAPAIIGWTLMDLVSRCFFALNRPKIPMFAAFLPVSVNLVVIFLLGKGSSPALLGLGLSGGLAAGFLALFAAAHTSNKVGELQVEPVEVA